MAVHCVTARILEACLRAGARGARAGEFTERAYFNGKMDLTQAEAVIDLIRAQNRSGFALRDRTTGRETRRSNPQDSRMPLSNLIANIEGSIDFPEEGISPHESKQLRAHLDIWPKSKI